MTVSGSQQLLENVRGNGEALVASSRRSGLLVEYAGGKFTFKSGKTETHQVLRSELLRLMLVSPG